ncbi:MAG: hypothetical protein SGJ18_08730 [Pseudomonadota bacterium]|nr:hypothetical protein [Pseudomonadota bacterium]
MKNTKLLNAFLFAASLSFGVFALAEESTLEKVETGKNKAVSGVKSTYRNVKDKTCEMINGKLECLGKKIKGKANNLSDDVKTKATEVKNKID